MTQPQNLPVTVTSTAVQPAGYGASRDQRADVATTDTDSWTRVVADVVRLADHIAGTEFVPKGLRGSSPATAAAMLYGREVGLPPMTSLNVTHVIEGKPGISAEAMRALILAAGHDLEFVESTSARCTIRGRRRGRDGWTEVTWTIDDARTAGLLNKNNWKGYPRRQLQARASSELAQMLFPDVIHGFRAIEDIEDDTTDDGQETTPGTPAPAAPATRVTRAANRRRTPPAEAPAPSAPRDTPEAATMPLPGEPGYDPTTTDDAADSEGRQAASPAAGSGDVGRNEEPAASPPQDDEERNAADVQEQERPAGARKASPAQVRMLAATMGRFNIKERDERLDIVGRILGGADRVTVDSTNDLTSAQASQVIDTLGRLEDRAALDQLLASYQRPQG